MYKSNNPCLRLSACCLNVLYCVELIHIDIGRLADKAEIFLIRILQQSPGYPQALETKILFHLPSPIQFIILGLQSFRVRLCSESCLYLFLFPFLPSVLFIEKVVKESSRHSVVNGNCKYYQSLFSVGLGSRKVPKTGNGITENLKDTLQLDWASADYSALHSIHPIILFAHHHMFNSYFLVQQVWQN